MIFKRLAGIPNVALLVPPIAHINIKYVYIKVSLIFQQVNFLMHRVYFF